MLRYGDVPDPMVRLGSYDLKPKSPYILGRNFSGVISEFVPGVDDLAIGHAVFGVID